MLLAAMGILFFLWYVGLPAIGLTGAREERLLSAIAQLEMKADLQRNLVIADLQDSSADLSFISESVEIKRILTSMSLMVAEKDLEKNADKKADKSSASSSEKSLEKNLESATLSAQLENKFQILSKARSRRFRGLMLIDLSRKAVLASAASGEQTTIPEQDLNALAASPDFDSLILSWSDTQNKAAEAAHKVQAIVLPVKLHTTEPTKIVLLGLLDLDLFLQDRLMLDADLVKRFGTTLLFDAKANLVFSFPKVASSTPLYIPDRAVLGGFEGSVSQRNAADEELIAVYRNLRLSPTQMWTMVLVTKKSDVLSGLLRNIDFLLVAGCLISLLALSLIRMFARRLTRPLDGLASSAAQLGRGDLAVRAAINPDDTGEIRTLTTAFNGMADAVQNAQESLEATIADRSQELAWSEARHLTLFNATASAVIVMDVRRMIDCNPAAVGLFGARDRQHLMQCKPIDLSPEFQTEGRSSLQLSNHYFALAREHGAYACEWIHQRLDTGVCFDAEVLLNLVELDGKSLIQASVRDISVRKKVEAALHASEERHRTLVEWSPEGINVHRKGRLIYVNASAIRMLGASSAEQLIGRPITEIIHPDFHHLLQTRIKTMNEPGGQEQSYEIKFVKVDGTAIDVMAQGALIEFDGAPSVYVAWHDATEAKRHAESQRIAATAFESQEGMFVTDANWLILRTNQSFNQITGFHADEIVGQPPRFLSEQFKQDSSYLAMLNSIAERGAWQGEVADQRKNGSVFPAWVNISSVTDEAGVITHYVGTFNDITLRKTAEDEIRNLAFYDPLTQLPNRRLLMDRLEQALASGNRHHRKGALLFIDLDNFKTLNDTLGHDHGDLLLRQVAERLSLCTREGDTVARLGGDEFVVMLENLDEDIFDAANQAETVAIKILSELNQTYWLGVNEHHSSPSIGVTLFGEKPETIAEPLKRADLAMYQAKAAGRNTVRFFDPKMQAMVTQRAELEEDLRDAMLNDQFELHYQAQFNDQGQLFAAEALIRWRHPERGLISPAEFIPIAEDTGLITILGYWVLNTAMQQLAKWAQYPEFACLTLAVNVSPSQFHQKNFVDQVTDVIDLTGADPRRLKLELTEGFSISNIEEVIARMAALRQRGVSFSLDDFGTGYSSLSYLKRLPLDQLKIDQSFVRDILIDPNDAAIAKMVIVLADSLGLSVVAEGVETLAQKAFLEQQGCRAYQGFLYSKPLALAEFEAFARHAYQVSYT